MKPTEKELLIRDLCARFPYGVVVQMEGKKPFVLAHIHRDAIPVMKPYLRPMSSMTKEEDEEYRSLPNKWADTISAWFDRKMFDHRGLLPKGLALEASEGMYKK